MSLSFAERMDRYGAPVLSALTPRQKRRAVKKQRRIAARREATAAR